MTARQIVAHWIHVIIAPYDYFSRQTLRADRSPAFASVVQLPPPNAHVSAIEQRQYERVSEQAAKGSVRS
jgi:hypothetical protein